MAFAASEKVVPLTAKESKESIINCSIFMRGYRHLEVTLPEPSISVLRR